MNLDSYLVQRSIFSMTLASNFVFRRLANELIQLKTFIWHWCNANAYDEIHNEIDIKTYGFSLVSSFDEMATQTEETFQPK